MKVMKMPDKTTEPRKHTLEKMVESMGKDYDEERLHAALLLSYAESIYSVVAKDCTPSPIYRLFYDQANNNVDIEETRGMSLPPKQGALDISVIDELFCSDLRDIPVLLEGETGIGKTFPAMKYMGIILGKGTYVSNRLSANAFINNLFASFQEGKMVNGMPEITARVDRIESTGAVLTDELNRGDSNETLQLFDNEMHLAGKIYQLGTPVPELVDGKVAPSGRIKKLLLINAQNPAGSDDAKFTQTLQLDAAVDNRLLKVYVSNAAPAVGSTLWLGNGPKKPHDSFLEELRDNASRYGVKIADMAELEEDWLSVRAWITEASRTDKPIMYSAVELSDMMIAAFSGNLVDYYNYERRVIKEWDAILRKGVEIEEDLQQTQEIKDIQAVTESFKVPVIFRDIVQIKKIADVLATLKNVKDSLATKNPVQTYLDSKRYVTVREVASATALVARNKQKSEAISPTNAVNEVLNQYIALVEDYMHEAGYLATSFDLFDPTLGIKKMAVWKPIRDALQEGKGIDYLITRISEEAKVLTGKVSASEEIRNIIIARSVADLMTLCGFLNEYKSEIAPMLKTYDKKTKPSKVIEDLGAFYYRKLDENAMIMPDIYQHRIQRILGV